jgi:hypothetical protein
MALDRCERIERALVLAAYIVVRHGPQYAPYVERLEKELEAARRDDPVSRAQRILATYTRDGGTKAMLCSTSRASASVSPSP